MEPRKEELKREEPQEEEPKEEEPKEENIIVDRDEQIDTKEENEENEKSQWIGPIIIPLRDIDESKPFNPIPMLINKILEKVSRIPNVRIKKISIKSLKEPEEERKLVDEKKIPQAVLETVNKLIEEGKADELLDYIKSKQGPKKTQRKLLGGARNPLGFNPMQMVNEILEAKPEF